MFSYFHSKIVVKDVKVVFMNYNFVANDHNNKLIL